MTIDELHNYLFELLKIVMNICNEHNLDCFVDSGTLIGAVREKDFVPWDDDMDLLIFAEDYPRFKDIMNKYLPEGYKLVEPSEFYPGFYDFTVRIVCTDNKLRTETEEDKYYYNYQNCVSTDVFLLSKASNNKLVQRIDKIYVKLLYAMGMQFRYSLDYSKYTIMQKILLKTLSHFKKVIDSSKICKSFYKHISKHNSKNTYYRMTSNYTLNHIDILPEDWYNEKAKGRIRDYEVNIPAEYDKVLSRAYGDYMNPPKDREAFVKHLEY